MFCFTYNFSYFSQQEKLENKKIQKSANDFFGAMSNHFGDDMFGEEKHLKT